MGLAHACSRGNKARITPSPYGDGHVKHFNHRKNIMKNYEINQLAMRVLLDSNAVRQCVLHPDSYFTILEDLPSGVDIVEAKAVANADVELDRETLHSMVIEVFDTLPEGCRECEKINKE